LTPTSSRPSSTDAHRGSSRPRTVFVITLLGLAPFAASAVAACSGERYARPAGPTPRYEQAPLPPWDAGAPVMPDEDLGRRVQPAPLHAIEHR
jgi:hypothetical protein